MSPAARPPPQPGQLSLMAVGVCPQAPQDGDLAAFVHHYIPRALVLCLPPSRCSVNVLQNGWMDEGMNEGVN